MSRPGAQSFSVPRQERFLYEEDLERTRRRPFEIGQTYRREDGEPLGIVESVERLPRTANNFGTVVRYVVLRQV